MPKMQFTGLMPAMITVFRADGSLDRPGIAQNVEFLIGCGVTGIVVNGSTGEAIALSAAERIQTIETVVKQANGRVPIIAGTAAPTTGATVQFTEDAKKAGADAALILTPMGEIPNPEGLYRHYATIHDAVDIPLILYNLPAHTGITLDIDTLGKLVALENVVGIKESSGNLSNMAEIVARYGEMISVINGCDDLIFQAMLTGASGNILALGNIAPARIIDLLEATALGDLKKAKTIYFQLLPIVRLISESVNFPAPIKEAVRQLGRPSGPPRLPVVEVTTQEKHVIAEALKHAGLL